MWLLVRVAQVSDSGGRGQIHAVVFMLEVLGRTEAEVNRLVGQVQAEGIFPGLIHKIQGQVGQVFGDVPARAWCFHAVDYQGAVVIHALPAFHGEGDEAVQAPQLGQAFAGHVPFADKGGVVSGVVEVFEKGAVFFVVPGGVVGDHAVGVGVLAG